MLEMIMPKSLKALILHQANSTTTLLTESEIISMFACASRLLVRNSEIVSENSQLCSMSAQSIGSCLGPNKPWYLWLTPSYQASNSLMPQLKSSNN